MVFLQRLWEHTLVSGAAQRGLSDASVEGQAVTQSIDLRQQRVMEDPSALWEFWCHRKTCLSLSSYKFTVSIAVQEDEASLSNKARPLMQPVGLVGTVLTALLCRWTVNS